jgi:hypothetical protein
VLLFLLCFTYFVKLGLFFLFVYGVSASFPALPVSARDDGSSGACVEAVAARSGFLGGCNGAGGLFAAILGLWSFLPWLVPSTSIRYFIP